MNDLAMKARNGDEEALLQLWQGVSRLAVMLALRYHNAAALNGAADDDDLKQCAFLGFLEALEGFDPIRGHFPSYMAWHVKSACRKLLGLNGRERCEHYQAISLDAPLPSAEDLTLAETIPDESAAAPFSQTELKRDIENALHRLPAYMADIIRLHDMEGMPMEEAGVCIGYTTETARNLRRAGFYRLRRDRTLSDYRDAVRLRYKGWRAFRSDWTSVVEEEVIRRVDGK